MDELDAGGEDHVALPARNVGVPAKPGGGEGQHGP